MRFESPIHVKRLIWLNSVPYLIALGCVVAASVVRIWLDPLFGEKFPYVTYMFAIIFVAWYGGLGPSLLTMTLGFLSAFYFFASPRGSFKVQGVDGQVGAVLYIVTSLSSILFSELMRAAERRAKSTALELQTQRLKLESEVLERKTAQDAYVSLLRRIVSVQEDERRRISRELHDQCGQDLTALHLELKMLENALKQGLSYEARLQSMRHLLEQVTNEIHRLAVKVRPSSLDDLGLTMAVTNHLQAWMSLTGVTVDYECRGWNDVRVQEDVETALFRVLQEALTNVARHADARSVNVVLYRDASNIGLIVEDQGHGFDFEFDVSDRQAPQHLGLLGMRERMLAIGGSLEIESAVQSGTTIYARVPCQSAVRHSHEAN
ncbi:MAG: nreB [Planctomycetaceae bacterium]|nr:nreB [Planctomycetaceae bacterium]